MSDKYGLLTPSCNINTVVDGRGGIFTWNPKEPIKEFNMLYFTPGASRGNHMHPGFTEYFLIVEGSGVMVYKESPEAKEEIIHMSKGSCGFAKPGVAHAFHAITNVTAIAMLTTPWDECNPPIIHEKVTDQRRRKTIGLFGATGFVGSQLSISLKKLGHDVTDITRDNFNENLGKEFDYVINAACPGARFKANQNPEWDYKETVEKTKQIYHGVKFQKFIQISSISARTQQDTPYGKNRFVAENLVNDGNALIVRLGPMFGPTLQKGVLIDMLNHSTVFVGENSKYSFAPLEEVGDWIAKNLDKKGVCEFGARSSIVLKDLAKELGIKVNFDGEDDFQEPRAVEPDYPDINLVIEFMKEKLKNGK